MPDVPPPPDRIVVVDQDELHLARMTNPQAFADPRTIVIAAPLSGEVIENPHLNEARHLLQPGAVLLRNPIGAGPRYVVEALAREELSVAKYHAFVEVAQKAGVSSIAIVGKRTSHNGRSWNAGAEVSAGPLADLRGGVDSNSAQRILERIKVEVEFEQQRRWSRSSRSAVEKAQQTARRLGVEHDAATASLLRMAADPDNRITKYRLQLEVTAEASKTIESTLRLEMILRKISPSIAAAFRRLRADNDSMVLDIVVRF